jgi:acyl-CoA reductase-like NAD-dependent aldehyde dehydrogenase
MTPIQSAAQTALQTAASLAPALAAGDPRVAAIASLAPLALTLLQAATNAQQAGLIPPEQLAGLFASIGRSVQSTHDEWAAMNAAEAAAAK